MALLLELWTIKVKSSNGRPFAASGDLHMAALDIIMAATFDFPQSDTTLIKQIEHSNKESPMKNTSQNEPFLFSTVQLDPELEAFTYLTQSFAVPFRSPLPYLGHWLYLQKPRSRRARQNRKQMTERNIEKSISRLENSGQEAKLVCAVDQLLLREKLSAEKLGIAPNFYKSEISDEVCFPFHLSFGNDSS